MLKNLNSKSSKFSRGFTLIEILVVIGIIAILAAVVLIAINPARQFAQANNSQRISNLNAILNAVGQNMADNKGILTCGGVAHVIPTTAANINNSVENIAPCIVPTYMPSMPVDPTGSSSPACVAKYTDNTTYETCYTIVRDASTGRITVSAPNTRTDVGNATYFVSR